MDTLESNQFRLMRIIMGKDMQISVNYQELEEIIFALEDRYKKIKNMDNSKNYYMYIKNLKNNLKSLLTQY
jgi:hypothetical protein